MYISIRTLYVASTNYNACLYTHAYLYLYLYALWYCVTYVVMLVIIKLYLNDQIELLRSAKKLTTPIEEVFGGMLVSTIICRECLTVSTVAA